MSSRQRLYLSLRKSITELFKTRAYYLKEMVGKQSIFEKPYLDQDYRQMHLNLPVRDWTWPEIDPGGIWPKGDYWSAFVFGEGKCNVQEETGECGELIKLSASIDQLCMGPYSGDLAYTWNAISSDQELAIIQPIEQHLFGASATIPIQLSEENTGTVTICVTVRIAEGSFIKEIVFPVPLPWWDPKYDWRWQNLQYMLANVFPSKEKRLEAKLWDCGCIDLEVNCCDDSGMSWDSDTSASTIQRWNDCVVAIKDSLGSGGPYAWSVSGTGYSLDYAETTGLLNTLNADGTACDPAIITVTGCDGKEVEGEVWCTAGAWVNKYICDNCDITSCTSIIPECCCFWVDLDVSPIERKQSYMHCCKTGNNCNNYCGVYGWWEGGCENTDPACTESLGVLCWEDAETPPNQFYWTSCGGSRDEWECT